MGYTFLDDKGTFELKNAGANSYLYFPLCNEAGLMGSVTPDGGGDLMLDQNRFILPPTSSFDLHNNKSKRNFWLRFPDGSLRSVTGASVWQKAEGHGPEEISVRGGLLWHESSLDIEHGDMKLRAEVMSFVPADATKAQVMRARIQNMGSTEAEFEPMAVIPLYGRSAVNLRDHRHVTSLLHRISTERYGVRLKPTLSFDERGHLKNHTEYFVLGCDGSGNAPEAFLPTADHVIGEGGDYEFPRGLMRKNGDPSASAGVAAGCSFEGVEAAGGLIFEKCRLKPAQSCEYIIFIGAREEDDEYNGADSIMERLGSSEKLGAALETNERYWLEKAQAGLGHKDGHGELWNYKLWVSAEPVLRRIFGCSFLPYHDYGKGGRGWRDLWQDCLALMLGDPSQVRDLLVNNYAGVRADGTNATIIGSRPGEFIADRNGIARVWMDHGVWPWITMRLYMELSGDEAVMDTEQSYFKDRLCMRARAADEEYDSASADNTLLMTQNGDTYRGSLFEHILLMHITTACETGEHGNMLLRGADWNDALDMAPEKGESVAFTAAYAGNLKTLAEFIAKRGGKVSLLKELAELTDGLFTICAEQKGSLSDEFDTPEATADCSVRKRGILEEYCRKVRHTVSGEKVMLEAKELAGKLNLIADSVMEHIRRNERLTSGDLTWFNGYYDNEGQAVESIEDRRVMLTGAVFTIMSGTATDEDIGRMLPVAEKYLFRKEIGGFRLNTRFKDEEAYAHKLGRMFGFAYGTKENGAVFCHMAVMFAYALLIRGFKEEADRVIEALVHQSMDFETVRIYPGIPEYFDPNGRGMYPYLTGAASWLLLYWYRRRQ
ncbi:MAG: cellobiose phosphorylase [Lachnospiraceae bacterium]|nr:cellobiose phosphorylase [Lachnospiraceae bacterium]